MVHETGPLEGTPSCSSVLQAAADSTAAFASRHGLACPSGCGACCLSPHVECSVNELSPLAEVLLLEGRAEAVLLRVEAQQAAGSSVCALYEPQAHEPNEGSCSEYSFRPLVCRLFGFSARRNRLGEPELVACKVMRDAFPEEVEATARAVAAGASAPSVEVLAHGVVADAMGTDGRPRPINEALKVALERALLRSHLESRVDHDEPGDDPTPRPVRPRRGRAA